VTLKETKSTCCYCGVGCGVIIQSDQNKIINVVGDPDHPANYGRLCTKGSALHLSTDQDARALYPEIRSSRGKLRERATWDQGLDLVVKKFGDIIERHGPNAVAFYISGQLMTEDYYVFNKLAKGLIGTNNLDTNSRLCMSSAVAGYKTSLGVDAQPACYDDINHANCIFLAGSNTAFAHPIVFRRIEDAKEKNPNLKIIVVDPRKTETAKYADIHLAILPGTDIALFNGMLHAMLWDDRLDHAFIENYTEGFSELKKTVREYTPKMAAEICGISEFDLVKAATHFAEGPTLSMWCMGLNQSIYGTHKNSSLINLHLASGQIGKPGAGPLSLTGQPNAMGGREVGGLSHLLSGHRDMLDAQDRKEVCDLWGVDSIPKQPGKTAVEMFESLRSGEIKAIWIACTNPAHSMPNLNVVHEALSKAEFVVLQDAFKDTDTNPFADVFFPATTWGEKEGTVTNSERRITRVNSAVKGPGESRHDWDIALDFAHRLERRFNKARSIFNFDSLEDIFNEHRLTTVGRDLDISGLSYTFLEKEGPQQWPYIKGSKITTPRLYTDFKFATKNNRARFINTIFKEPADRLDVKHPFRLITGRLRDQWHGMSRTGNVAQLCNHDEAPIAHMSPHDMHRRSVKDADLMRLSNRRGSLIIQVQASDDMKEGELFIPMHWGSRFMSGLGVNALTTSAFDSISKQPELKYASVNIEKIELGWHMTVMKTSTDHSILEKMRNFISKFDYATCNLYGRNKGVIVFRAFNQLKPDSVFIDDIDSLLGMSLGAPLITYEDKAHDISKRVLVENKNVTGVRLVGETLATQWLREVMVNGNFTDELRRWALAPLKEPPVGGVGRGKIVCVCLDVSEKEIIETLEAGADLETLKNKLKCGTECGSCIPELKAFGVKYSTFNVESVSN